jgi:callose synthase
MTRELDLMTIPMSPEIFSGMVGWPVFLLANKVYYLYLEFFNFFFFFSVIVFHFVNEFSYLY